MYKNLNKSEPRCNVSFAKKPKWICRWPDSNKAIEIGGEKVGVLAGLSEDEKGYIIKTKRSSNDYNYSYVDLYLNKEDAFAGKNRFIRQYFSYDTNEMPLKSIENPIAEDIYGNWQPREFTSVVSLDYGEEGKQENLEQGKFEIEYSIRQKEMSKSMFGHLPNISKIDGESGILLEIRSSKSSKDYPKKLLQEKIFDKGRAQNERFAAVLRGIENEDVTTYICNYFGNQKLKELEENGVYLRFPHNGDGYWEDYFFKPEYKTLSHKQKQDKFIHDLGLHEKQNGFAIVPFKYNDHFVTLVVDCSSKTINLFDSSLYTVSDNGEKKEAFRDFLVGDEEIFNSESESLLNHSDLQGGKLEGEPDIELPKEDPPDCYDMGTCGFWTLAFCIEAANCENFQELQEKCKSNEFFIRIAKRVSAIIDSRDSVKEEDLGAYKIPANSVCITSSFKQETELSEDEIGQATEYCTEMRQMLIAVGPDVKRETGKSSSAVLTEQHQNDNRYILNTTSSFKHSLNQSPLKQPKSKSLPAKETKSPDYWKNKVRKSKSTSNLFKSEHVLG